MGLKSRSRKGEISISDNNGRLRLRWRYAGERYSLNLSYPYLPENMHHATLKIAEIKLDIAKGCFDTTLEKYNPSLLVATIPKTQPVSVSTKPDNRSVHLNELVKDFNDWGKNIRNVDVDNTTYYLAAKNFLEKCRNVPIEQLPQQLNKENWSNSTYNERLSLLKNFFAWLMDEEMISKNPLKGVRRKKNKKRSKNPRRMPLEPDEIIRLLHAIKNDTHCPPASNFKHSHYYPFWLLFLLQAFVMRKLSGCGFAMWI